MPQKASKTSSSKKAKDDFASMKFEDALKELESIVTKLESGEQSLEASLEQFEKGIKLSRHCQKSLSEAEQKVQMLVEENGEDHLIAVTDDDTGS